MRIRPSNIPLQGTPLQSNHANPDLTVTVHGPFKAYGVDLVPDVRPPSSGKNLLRQQPDSRGSLITLGLAATRVLHRIDPLAFSLANLFFILGTLNQSLLKHPQRHFPSLAIEEWAKQRSNEPTHSTHQAKALPGVVVEAA
ncbi:MAG: hypothetical protein M3O31_14160 [Acidobacteriota bacterium]|nr:hypothetical protein [Acidobacteriota bacterium]